jgi:hypothetical protein
MIGAAGGSLASSWWNAIVFGLFFKSRRTGYAGPSRVVRQNGKAIRINAPQPETKEPSLSQAVIARWPHDGPGINSASLANPIELPSLNWEN